MSNKANTWAVYNAKTGGMIGKELTEAEARNVASSVTRSGKVAEVRNEAKPLVTWKDEGDTGPVTTYSADARSQRHALREYGSPLPEGQVDSGWMTRSAAVKLADLVGADFEEC